MYIVRENNFLKKENSFCEKLTEPELNQFIKDRVTFEDLQDYFIDDRAVKTRADRDKVIDNITLDIKFDIVENILGFLIASI